MPGWLVGLLVAAGVYALAVLALAVAGRRTHAVALARFIPDCVVLVRRLAVDPRLPRWTRWLLLATLGYLVIPIDLVPDVVPVAGALDDAIVVGLVLRAVVRAAGPEAIREAWPGPEPGLRAVLLVATGRGGAASEGS
ncbi:MAG TPA: YkvA family protein [Capillimicrobium sp.]|nr:YkvA family protein [Capillimicrobium sp.]